jgi:hypothetical protein
MMMQVKNGAELFWREKKTFLDRLRCSQATFFAKCKIKKTHKDIDEPWAPLAMASTTTSGPFASGDNCHF